MPTDPSMINEAGDPTKFPETLRLPTDATRNFSDRVTASITGLAHRTAFLRRLLLEDTIWLDLPSGRPQSVDFPDVRFAYTGGFSGGGGDRFGWVQDDISDTGSIYWQIQIPFNAKIVGTTAHVLCEPIALGSLPATMPRILTWRQPTSGAPPASDNELLLEQIDPSVDHPTFNDYHTIGGAWPASPTLLSGDVIVMQYKGMAGGGAANNALKLFGLGVDIEPIPAP
jgi:hypothetical protein